MGRDEDSNGQRLIEKILGEYAVIHLAGSCCQCGVELAIRVSQDGIENGTVCQTPASWYMSSQLIGKCPACSRYNTPFRKPTDIFSTVELRPVGALLRKNDK